MTIPMTMPINDTTCEARDVQFRILRAMSGEQRMMIALEMSLFVRESARSRMQVQHPEWDEARIERELLKIAFFPHALPAGLR
jgi:hypothetical protein